MAVSYLSISDSSSGMSHEIAILSEPLKNTRLKKWLILVV